MDGRERAEIIRRGNELFNQGSINEAIKLFVKARYGDGILRVADVYYYDKKQPLIALRFYRMINRKDRMDEIFARMMFAFKKLVTDKPAGSPEDNSDIEVKIHPKLRLLAEEIIRDTEGEKK